MKNKTRIRDAYDNYYFNNIHTGRYNKYIELTKEGKRLNEIAQILKVSYNTLRYSINKVLDYEIKKPATKRQEV